MGTTWTQAICDDCWNVHYPDKEAHRLLDPDSERCCFCGDTTESGLYIRINPYSVPYPRTSPSN